MPSSTTRDSIGNYLTAFLNTVLGLFLKLMLAALALVFAFALLAAALIYLAWGGVVFLLTGRKPAVAVLFSQFRQLKKFSAGGVWPRPGTHAADARAAAPDVIDVEVREIPGDIPGNIPGENPAKKRES